MQNITHKKKKKKAVVQSINVGLFFLSILYSIFSTFLQNLTPHCRIPEKILPILIMLVMKNIEIKTQAKQ